MRRLLNGQSIFAILFCVIFLGTFVSCTTVPRTTYTVYSNNNKEVAFYAVILALQQRGYLLEKADLESGYIVTKKRQHETGKFWWQIVCKIDPSGVVNIDILSNLVQANKMHRRARHWIHQIKQGTEKILQTMSTKQILTKGKNAYSMMID